VSPSGKASGFDPDMRGFESLCPSQGQKSLAKIKQLCFTDCRSPNGKSVGVFFISKVNEGLNTMALSNRVTSITEESYVPSVIDGVLNSNVFLARTFMRTQKVWSGRQMQIPLQFAKPASGGSFSGTGDFDTSLQDTRVRQTFSHAQFYQNVSVSGGEASLNKTDGEVLDLMKVTMEEAQNAMLDSIGTQVYGVGTGDDFLGLGAIVDAGANTSTYGSLSRTTFPMLNSTVTANATMSFTNMATSMRGASAAGTGRQRPSIVVTTETIWDLLESLYTPTINSTYQPLSRVQITAYSKPGVAYKDQDSLKGQLASKHSTGAVFQSSLTKSVTPAQCTS
jgi:hypothetical protein